ncbi:MAG: undecaprenyl/decaprenyl-phosphate alpha-N-acetylglucosaminyl 1-phosphate transferase [Chlorobi bacterium]|nr:undecaprenyl/decaprenyl-phosphate alpha-N-acetylglucosaminyl 1-phosphate transferase [Chlorobiota bacterium]
MDVFLNYNIRIIFAFIAALLAVLLLTPSIIRVARAKDLVAKPNGRTTHTGFVPALGGFPVFTSILIVLLFFIDFAEYSSFAKFLLSATIIFAVGLKDDILIIDPYKKLGGEIIASLILIVFFNIRFTSMHGFLGINELPYGVSLILTLFAMVVITNSFNLIDGIDGLAGGVGIITTFAFGTWFYLNQYYEMAVFSAAIIGSYLGFLYYNFSKGENKIFLGDSGSLLLGFTLAFLSIKFNQLCLSEYNQFVILASPSVSFGILILPLFDTLRIIVVRLFSHKRPFAADKKHIHHRLLELLKSHKKTTAVMLIVNIAFIVMVYYLQFLGIVNMLIVELVIATILSFIPAWLIKRKSIKNQTV